MRRIVEIGAGGKRPRRGGEENSHRKIEAHAGGKRAQGAESAKNGGEMVAEKVI
jgi:hypothetical protein